MSRFLQSRSLVGCDHSAVFSGISTGYYTLGFESQDPDGDSPYFGPALDISASVPDGGTTFSLLGIALAGFGVLRRKQA